MFLIFKIFPDWTWWLLLATGIGGLGLSTLPQLQQYALVLKTFACSITAAAIFTLGVAYADHTWTQAAKNLESQVQVLKSEMKATSQTVEQKLVYRTKTIRERGTETVRYIEHALPLAEQTCQLPPEFIISHNRAAEQPK
jgi:hypothetical protein